MLESLQQKSLFVSIQDEQYSSAGASPVYTSVVCITNGQTTMRNTISGFIMRCGTYVHDFAILNNKCCSTS
jgi:hypothetical protein